MNKPNSTVVSLLTKHSTLARTVVTENILKVQLLLEWQSTLDYEEVSYELRSTRKTFMMKDTTNN